MKSHNPFMSDKEFQRQWNKMLKDIEKNGRHEMKPTKLDKLKAHLKKWEKTRSLTEASDICAWLYKELIKENDND